MSIYLFLSMLLTWFIHVRDDWSYRAIVSLLLETALAVSTYETLKLACYFIALCSIVSGPYSSFEPRMHFCPILKNSFGEFTQIYIIFQNN